MMHPIQPISFLGTATPDCRAAQQPSLPAHSLTSPTAHSRPETKEVEGKTREALQRTASTQSPPPLNSDRRC
ncbi:hypothetical protein P167DRAFT_535250 [Morchella conica CCBAS932]|uniref:Uncharacterized protein n=1 Tax=Morchella conica CCBAS932 TaxID=1392247 RepID=A0A3N4KUX0_9PEZI|nr:hypothetical protein P167DRAFT_535250 [Morchella conica CCBAS932]